MYRRPGCGLGISAMQVEPAPLALSPPLTLFPMEQLQPLPRTYLGFYREWRKINPDNHGPIAFLREKLRNGEEIRRAQILSYAYDSHSINRSAFHTLLLVLGETGVGKSSTINHLFGANVAPISFSTSSTRATTEFLLKDDDIDMGVKDLTLGLIDTPGFNDTDGIEQDACNLASIYTMLNNHEPLQSLSASEHSGGHRLFPNVILVLLRAAEKRFEGANSNFCKSLMAIREMAIVDTKKANVLVVLTHAMAFGNPHGNAARWRTQIRTKARRVQNIVEKILRVSPPVVWIENNYTTCSASAPPPPRSMSSSMLSSASSKSSLVEEEELMEDEEEGHDLPTDGEWTMLPDGSRQVVNLYKAIADLLKANGDNLGLHTINTFFKTKYEGPVLIGARFEAKTAKRCHLEATEEKMLKLLKRDLGLSDIEGEEDENEVKERIQGWMESARLDDLQSMEAYRLIILLCSQLKIRSIGQLSVHSVGSLRQNLSSPSQLTRLHVRMLEEIFGVREQKRRLLPIVSCVGRGFDLIHDEIKARNIFELRHDDSEDNLADFGIQVPKGVVLSVARQTSTFMEDFQSEEEYVQRRLSDLQVAIDIVEPQIFRMRNRGGFTRSKNISNNASVQQYSYLLEKRLFSLRLVDLRDANSLVFSPSFQRALDVLPRVYDKTNLKVVRDLQDFFNNWGQYVVAQAYAGGSMEVQVASVQDDDSDTMANLIAARVQISGMLHSSDEVGDQTLGMSKGKSMVNSSKLGLASASVNWLGGDTQLQLPALDAINADLLHQWEQSLAVQPAVLTTDLTLIPIYELVEDEEQRLTLRAALDDLLRGRLVVQQQHQQHQSKDLDKQSSEITQSLNEITSRVQRDLMERQVTTRKGAVSLSRPVSKCFIL